MHKALIDVFCRYRGMRKEMRQGAMYKKTLDHSICGSECRVMRVDILLIVKGALL